MANGIYKIGAGLYGRKSGSDSPADLLRDYPWSGTRELKQQI